MINEKGSCFLHMRGWYLLHFCSMGLELEWGLLLAQERGRSRFFAVSGLACLR